jgi:hypothetical protein
MVSLEQMGELVFTGKEKGKEKSAMLQLDNPETTDEVRRRP